MRTKVIRQSADPAASASRGRGTPRVAVIGTGMIGAIHARAAVLAGAELVGVAASTPGSASQAAAEWGVPVAYGEAAECIADERIDVVHVCTPNALHYELARAALLAGKHVVCEKPLATSGAQARELARLASRQQRVATVPFVYRYHPIVREIRARRIAGEFGAWQLLHGSYLQDWMLPPEATGWRVDPERGGPSRTFADIGSHWCDLVEWVAGVRFSETLTRMAVTRAERPERTAPSFTDAVHTGSAQVARTAVRTEDVAAALLRTEDGLLASATFSQVSAGRKNRLWFELDGESGSAVFDQEQPESAWLGGLDCNRTVVRDPERGSGEQRRLAVLPAGHPQGYRECFDAFVADTYAAIAGARPDSLPTFEDGLRSTLIVDAALESHRTSSWTEIAR